MKKLILCIALILFLCTPILTGCGNTDREATIAFTREALGIERQRNDLISLRQYYALPIAIKFFIDGYKKINNTQISQLTKDMPSITALRAKLIFLSCPQGLENIRASLVEVYTLETGSAKAELGRLSDTNKGSLSDPQFYYEITYQNIDVGKTEISNPGCDWVIAQELRRDAYIQWSQILKDNGVNLQKEGFTALAQ
jgi:hypothetical protein